MKGIDVYVSEQLVRFEKAVIVTYINYVDEFELPIIEPVDLLIIISFKEYVELSVEF